MAPERVLVNVFYAHPVGHAIEALHYCLGHHVADPTREIAVALSARTPVALARWCPFVSHVYATPSPRCCAPMAATRRRCGRTTACTSPYVYG